MEFHEILDALIEDGNIQVQDLADRIGVSRQQIARWRKGNYPEMGIFKLKEICKVYGVSADYLLDLPQNLNWPRKKRNKNK